MAYEHLTPTEKALVDEYRNLRSISDWAGFTDGQRARREECRREIERERGGVRHALKVHGEGAHRRERLHALDDEALRVGSSRREVRLPAAGCTPTEKAYVEEREVLLAFKAATPGQRARKTANADWLVRRRKSLYGLIKRDGDAKANRRARYRALCIATGHGTPYREWAADHDPKTGEEKPEPKRPTPRSARAKCIHWHTEHEGITEQPAGSNTDSRKDGIRNAQIDCAGGGGGLIGTSWCGEWCHQGLIVAGVPSIGTWWMASVLAIEMKARAGLGPYRGWNSGYNTRGVLPGDQVVIGGHGVHVETVREVRKGFIVTNGGNTSPGRAGSQSNGGGAFRRTRYPGEVVGFAKVDFPG